MPDIPLDDFTFWVFIIPGFLLVWAFRYFTESDKKGDFEFFGLGIFCGFLNFLLFGFLVKWGIMPNFKDGTPLFVAGFILSIISFAVGLLCAQTSKYDWFKGIIKRLRSKWF